MWAHIIDGKIFEVTDIDPKGRFHESFVWAKCPVNVRQDWLYDGSKFTALVIPELPADPVADEISRRQFFPKMTSSTLRCSS